MFLPPECLETLKCSLCKRLLSVFPIYINKNDQQSSVCGRCQLPDDDNYLRCEIYENVAKNVQFPCVNKESGCMLNLLPEDMEQHEKICSYRAECCFLAQKTNCDWKGPMTQLYVHYLYEHEELLLKNNQFEFDVSEDHDFINILQYWNEMFIFQSNFNQKLKQLICSVRRISFTRFPTIYVQVELTTKDTTIVKKFPKMDSVEQEPKSIDINIESALSKHDSKVTGKILIVDKEEKIDYNTKLNQDLLQQMKCFKCKKIIIHMLYYCEGGHYACENCSSSCCSKTVLILLNVMYQKCPDCNYIEGNITNHRCLFKPINLTRWILRNRYCIWQGARIHIEKHLQNDHRDKILKLNEIIRLDIDKGSTERFIFYHDFYKLTVTKDVQTVSFEMNRTRVWSWEPNFRFEIGIFDMNHIEKIKIRPFEDIFYGFNYQLHQNQIDDILFNNTLIFRLSVLKR